MTSTVERSAGFSPADAITMLRIPLAVAFAFVTTTPIRLAILLLATLTDLGDGFVARKFGSSRIGVVLDPIADRLFIAIAYAVVLLSGKLTWYEVVAVLARDIVATIAYLITAITGRAISVPARLGGKAVTTLQLATLVVFVLDLGILRRLAWATAAVAIYAIWDYAQPFFSKLRTQ